jgi:sugar lactone lactonase YvrE
LSVAVVVGCNPNHIAEPPESPEGGLWVANNSYDTIPEFSTNQLGTSGTATPAQTLKTKGGDCPAGLALEAGGNMWLSDCDSDSLVMYSPAARNAGGTTAPTAVIVSSALESAGAENISFDSHGNLWVTVCNDTGIVEFSAAQVSAAGTQTPAVSITSRALGHFCPFGLTFDGSGNAWVGDDDKGLVVEYSAAQLASSGDKTPVTTITSAGLIHASGVAFDGSGNLWVSNEGGTVVAYTPTQLIAGGSQTPNVTLTLPNEPDPFGLAFDTHGTLWVSDVNNEVMLGLSSAQLATSASVTPSVTLGSTLAEFLPEQPLLDPYATAKGVAASRVGGHRVAPLGGVRPLRKNHHHVT